MSGDAAFTPRLDRKQHRTIEDYEPTTVANFFELWRDFDGKRLAVSFNRDWLDVTAVHDDKRISLAVTNMGGRQIALDLSGVAQRLGTVNAFQTRLNYHRGEVVFEPEHAVDAAAIPVDVNETTVIRLSLNKPLELSGELELNRWYAHETAIKSTGDAIRFPIKVDNEGELKSAKLLLGLHRRGGISEPVQVTINGTAVEIETGDANEFSEFFAPLDAAVPVDVLRANNGVVVTCQDGTTITSVQLLTHRKKK